MAKDAGPFWDPDADRVSERFHPSDFRTSTRDGVGADRPIAYEDLKRYENPLIRVVCRLPVSPDSTRLAAVENSERGDPRDRLIYRPQRHPERSVGSRMLWPE